MDFLGLKVTVISEAESHIRNEGFANFRVSDAPLEDEPYKLLNEARTIEFSAGVGWYAPALSTDDNFQCR